MENPAASDSLASTLAPQTALFGVKILQALMKNSQDSNVFISPISIHQILTLATNGALGETRDEMLKVLEIDQMSLDMINQKYKEINDVLLDSDKELILSIANSIWFSPDYQAVESFSQLSTKYYQAEYKPLTSVAEVNKWCSEATNGKITSILSSIEKIKAVLINAVYFKGLFVHPFKEQSTKDAPFHAPKGDVTVPMMSQRETKYLYKETKSYQALQIPYKTSSNKSVYSTVILPRDKVAIEDVMKELGNDLTSNTGFVSTSLNLQFPKFKLEYSQSLAGVLNQMGMKKAFSGSQANFEGLSKPGDLYVDDVIHKTFLEVNEKGAEAAAVTAVTMRAMCIRQFVEVKVDRPFMFFIQEKNTNSVLFSGVIYNPSSK